MNTFWIALLAFGSFLAGFFIAALLAAGSRNDESKVRR